MEATAVRNAAPRSLLAVRAVSADFNSIDRF